MTPLTLRWRSSWLFIDEPVSGLCEMGRVTRDGGVLCSVPLGPCRGRPRVGVLGGRPRLDGDVRDESALAGARADNLAELRRPNRGARRRQGAGHVNTPSAPGLGDLSLPACYGKW